MKHQLTLLIFFFLLSFSGFAQQLVISGTVTDRTTREPLSRVNIAIEGTSSGAITDANGHYKLKLKKADNYAIFFSHVGYADERRFIQPDDFPQEGKKEMTINVQLIFKIMTLPEVTISDVAKPDTVHGTQAYSLADFEFYNTDELLLLTFEKNLRKDAGLKVLNSKDSIVRSTSIDADPTKLYADFRGNPYVVYEEHVNAIEWTPMHFETTLFTYEEFEEHITPIVDSVNRVLLYSNYRWYYPEFSYLTFDRTNQSNTKIATVTDEHLMELYRSEYKYLSPRQRFEATKLEYETGIDKEDIAAIMSDFPNSLYYEPLYAPAFIIHDTVMIFDHYANELKKFNTYGDSIASVPIYYHQMTTDRSKWKQQLLKDAYTHDVYAVFLKDGHYHLRKIDLSTGRVIGNFKLTHRYVEKMRVKDGYVYYLYRPFGSIQNVYLYKEKIQ